MFVDTGSGFQIVFPNGCLVSVQWNPGTYSEHRRKHFGVAQLRSKTAEVWGWRGQTDRYGNPSHPLWPEPLKYQTPEQVAEHIYFASQYPPAD